MCGFVGALFPDPKRPDLAGRMRAALQSLLHRGPDGDGLIETDHAVMGHTRLSIIDLSDAARQPIQTASARYTMVFNGEIYNYRELHKSFLADRPEVNRNSDTAVLLALYETLGARMLEHLNGMFALVVWDAQTRTAFIARDRFGEKPLYLAHVDGALLFASECEAIRHLCPGRFEQHNLQAVAGYLHIGSIQAPNTIYKDIRALPPAHSLRVGIPLGSGWWRPERYWQLGQSAPAADVRGILTVTDARAAVRERLDAALESRLVSDVPVGLFLSGGIDSGALASLCASRGRRGIRGVFIDFEQSQFSELPQVEATAKAFDIELQRVVVTQSDFTHTLKSFFASADQPTSDGFNTYVVAKAAHTVGGKVWLSGVGGDELFGGYPIFRRMPRLRSAGRSLQSMRLGSAAGWLAQQLRLSERHKRALTLLRTGDPSLRAYQVARAPLTADAVQDLLPDAAGTVDWHDIDAQLRVAGIEGLDLDDFQRASLLESQIYMGGQLLRDMDNFSMAHSIELRAPLLDHRLCDLVFALPEQFKVQGTGPKPLLSGSLTRPLPARVAQAPKQGFTFPLELWMRQDFESAFEAVASHGELGKLIDLPALRRLWRQYQQGRVHWRTVWVPFALGRWLMART